MKKSIIVALALLIVLSTPLFAQMNTKVIAHRGFWDCEGSAQNSIASLVKAAEAGVYGSEFDVQLTKDGVPILFHDAHIKGQKIERYNHSKFLKHRLSNGEPIPTLRNFLEFGSELPSIKLILEIKTTSSPEADRVAVGIIVGMVNQMGLQARVEYISFSLHVVKELARLCPDSDIAYLNGELSPQEISELGINGLDYNIRVMLQNREWFAQAKSLGISTNVWTVNSEQDMRRMIELGSDFITTDKPLLLQNILKEHIPPRPKNPIAPSLL